MQGHEVCAGYPGPVPANSVVERRADPPAPRDGRQPRGREWLLPPAVGLSGTDRRERRVNHLRNGLFLSSSTLVRLTRGPYVTSVVPGPRPGASSDRWSR